MEIAAAARAGDGALAGVGLAEPRVVGEEVGVDGPVGDLEGADGTQDGFGHVEGGKTNPIGALRPFWRLGHHFSEACQ